MFLFSKIDAFYTHSFLYFAAGKIIFAKNGKAKSNRGTGTYGTYRVTTCIYHILFQVHLQTQQGGRKIGVISQTIHIGEHLRYPTFTLLPGVRIWIRSDPDPTLTMQSCIKSTYKFKIFGSF